MKLRRLIPTFICALVMSLVFATTALAKTGTYVFDETNVLSDEQFQELESLGAKYADQYKTGVYLLFCDNMGADGDSGSGRREFVRSYYTEHGLGYGDSKDGILLAIATTQRKLTCVKEYKDKSKDPFSDDAVERISDNAKEELKENHWYDAARSYYDDAGADLDYFATYGKQWKEPSTISSVIKIGVTIVVPLAVAAMVVSSEKKAMRTAVMQTEAQQYVNPNSFVLITSNDTFTHRTMDVTPIPKNDDNDSGGGGDGGWIDMGDGFSGYDGGDF